MPNMSWSCALRPLFRGGVIRSSSSHFVVMETMVSEAGIVRKLTEILHCLYIAVHLFLVMGSEVQGVSRGVVSVEET